jgi:two-component system C4-dicarboxylate transport sensor histidine kinase DctB
VRPPFDLEQLHRLERMGWLAAGLTHDLNNALVSVLAEIEALDRLLDDARRALGPGPPGEAARALEAGARSVATVRAALDTTVAQSRELQRVYRKEDPRAPVRVAAADVHAAVDKAIRLVRPRVAGAIAVAGPAQVSAAADESAVVRVVVNLLLNAAEAYPPGAAAPRIEVRVGSAGRWSVCDVTDHGPGIAPEIAAHLFEPFVTAKPAGSGMGLGLFVSRHLLRAAGGDLRLVSTGPAGTTFRLLLPIESGP